MKKYIITIIFALGIILNLSAQGDGFFSSYGSNESRSTGSANAGSGWSVTPSLPDFSATGNQPAPLGSGILLLAGMAFAYGLKKK